MELRCHSKLMPRGIGALCALIGLSLTLPAEADTLYAMQPVVKVGDTIGGVKITGGISLSALNDHGDLAFLTVASPGGQALFELTQGQLSLLVTGGGQGPDGPWPKSLNINALISLNQPGDIAFSMDQGIYLWRAASKQFTPAAKVGTPATDGLTFTGGAVNSPALNNRSEVSVGMPVKDAAGKVHTGVFLFNAEGKLLPVALTGQPLPDGSTINVATGPSTLNDAGVLGFFASRPGTGLGGYLWEQGSITPVVEIGTPLPGGATVTHFSQMRLNNKNREVLVALHQSDSPAAASLYRYRNGQFTPLLLPGRDLPGGGKFKSVREISTTDVGASAVRHISRANELGQFAFVATLEDGSVGAYLLDVDGKLSLILKTGMTTDQGPITSINPTADRAAVGLNSQGQVALTVKIAGGPETLVLLTPSTP